MNLKEALRLFLLEDRAPATTQTYAKVLRRAIDFLGPERDIDLITKEDVLRYVQHLRDQSTRYETHINHPVERGGLAPKTIEKHVKTLTTFFKWQLENGYRTDNPASNLRLRRYQRPPGSTKAASPEELQAILKMAELKAGLGHPKHLALFLFLADTGCRAGEASSLLIGNLSLDNGGAWVLGKGDKLRPVFFGTQTAGVLRDWLAVHPNPVAEEPLFGMTGRSISQVINRLARQAGLDRPIGAHAIRHAVATAWKQARVNMETIQLKLGHDDIVTTLKMYGNTTWDYVQHTSEELALAAVYGPRPQPFGLGAPRIIPGGKKLKAG